MRQSSSGTINQHEFGRGRSLERVEHARQVCDGNMRTHHTVAVRTALCEREAEFFGAEKIIRCGLYLLLLLRRNRTLIPLALARVINIIRTVIGRNGVEIFGQENKFSFRLQSRRFAHALHHKYGARRNIYSENIFCQWIDVAQQEKLTVFKSNE